MNRKSVRHFLFALATTLPAGAYAGDDSGFYIGGSIGSAEVDYSDSAPDIDDVDFKDEDTGYKVFGGFNFGLLPLLDLAAEVSYIDFGSQEDEIANVTGSIDMNAYTAAGLVGVGLGPIGVFGKVGYMAWDADYDVLQSSDSDSGTDPYYGIGAKLQLGSFAVRAEYEMFEADDADVDYYSVGAAYTF